MHCCIVVEITEENLEDLLAYDDLFLDYFNAFLALPVSYLEKKIGPYPTHFVLSSDSNISSLTAM